MKDQQIEYENRIRQLRVDLGALKDAYLNRFFSPPSSSASYPRTILLSSFLQVDNG